MKIKVSNVCQLMPIFTRSGVDRGVTYTHNGDGSITVNGTPTGTYYSVGTTALDTKSIKYGHKYIIYSIDYQPVVSQLIIANYQGGYFFRAANEIFTFPEHDYTRFVFEIRVNLNYTANNIVVRPQLFDLTEMYGAGNEPTTVEQFRQDFPNEMYEYSPECWKRFKELRYVTETKNLFNKSNAQIINGYISGDNVFSQSSLDKTIIVPCLPNTTYTFSKISVSPVACDRLRIGDYTAIPTVGDTINNVVNIGEPPTQNYITITTSDTAKYIVVTIGLFKPTVITSLDYILSTCQLELGSTATPYQPYGYLPLRTGRYRTETKNLIDSQQIYQISQHMNVTIWQGEVNYVCTFSYELAMLEPNNGGAALFEFTYSDGTYSYIIHRDKYKVLSQITDNKKLTSIRLINWSDVKGILSNIQLEKGTTATHYQPYKHIYFH